jgi:hypothetical protein
VARIDAEQAEVPVRFGRHVRYRRADVAEDCIEGGQRHLDGQIVKSRLCESSRCLFRFAGAHPRRYRGEPGQVVDLAEQLVIANDRIEHHGGHARACRSVRIQVDVERVLLERTRDDASSPPNILDAQRQHGRSTHDTRLLCQESPR